MTNLYFLLLKTLAEEVCLADKFYRMGLIFHKILEMHLQSP